MQLRPGEVGHQYDRHVEALDELRLDEHFVGGLVAKLGVNVCADALVAYPLVDSI